MRTRQKRTIVTNKDIRNMIEDNGMKYVLIPNGIFDELYMDEKQFTELDMTVFIFLQFMTVNKITTLNYEEMAKCVGCSTKQLKLVLKGLQEIKGKTNARYYSYEDKVEIVEEMEVSLISEKEHSAYNPKTRKNQKTLHWYTNYIPYYKSNKYEAVPVSFFMVTLEDLDLLTNKQLSRNEFVTYLFFLKAYKYGAADDKQMWWKLSTIAGTLNYKLVETVHNHVEKILNLKINGTPLLEEIRPKNYDLQISKGEEPSSRYIPRYNNSKMVEKKFGKQEVNLLKEKMDLLYEEMSSKVEEVNFENMEVNSIDLEMVF
ncbi:hypothetical protein V7266_30665 [Neobacillus drentensis]|uniref:hypothetical protein n=1 Tax=Neobacillus drentensis TaxID=220684 RepID=UPI002FFF4FA2